LLEKALYITDRYEGPTWGLRVLDQEGEYSTMVDGGFPLPSLVRVFDSTCHDWLSRPGPLVVRAVVYYGNRGVPFLASYPIYPLHIYIIKYENVVGETTNREANQLFNQPALGLPPP